MASGWRRNRVAQTGAIDPVWGIGERCGPHHRTFDSADVRERAVAKLHQAPDALAQCEFEGTDRGELIPQIKNILAGIAAEPPSPVAESVSERHAGCCRNHCSDLHGGNPRNLRPYAPPCPLPCAVMNT